MRATLHYQSEASGCWSGRRSMSVRPPRSMPAVVAAPLYIISQLSITDCTSSLTDVNRCEMSWNSDRVACSRTRWNATLKETKARIYSLVQQFSLGRLALVGKTLTFNHELSSFFLVLSIHRAQQPRSGQPSNVFRRFGRGKASTIGIGISSTSPLISTGSKSAKFGVVENITQLWAARIWKCSKISNFWKKGALLQWSPYVLAKFGEVGSTHPWESSVSSDPPLKLHAKTR